MAHRSPAAAALLVLILAGSCSFTVNGFQFKAPLKRFVLKVGMSILENVIQEVAKHVVKDEAKDAEKDAKDANVQNLGSDSVKIYNEWELHECCNGSCSTVGGESQQAYCRSGLLTFKEAVEANQPLVESDTTYYYLKVVALTPSPSGVATNLTYVAVVSANPSKLYYFEHVNSSNIQPMPSDEQPPISYSPHTLAACAAHAFIPFIVFTLFVLLS